MPEKILIITSEFPPQPGGIGNHAHNLALNLAKNDYLVSVIADEREADSEEQAFDAQLNFRVIRIKLKSLRFRMYINRIVVALREIKTAEIVMASGKFPLWLVAFSSYFYNRHYVAIIHGSEVNFRNPILKASINFALIRFGKVIAVSNFTKSLISKLELKSVVVIPNGFDASDWKAPDQISELKGQPRLITVGNVTTRKGQLNVIQHLPYLLNDYPNIHYHCVGLPTEKEKFEAIARKLNVAEHVTFHGRVKHQDLQQFLKASDIFVMLSSKTSSGDVEGFGIAILEANYLGIPAIGSIGCGIEDAIDDGGTGVLVDPLNAHQFKSAIETILKQMPTYSRNARDWAEKHTWDKVIFRYIKELETL
ncbi:MAG: glycosyltransferase family 4 protein [Saprospiraceae bacterium]|nr:glycosyltransferase family 4 protein [Saprospiraceae bacterium]